MDRVFSVVNGDLILGFLAGYPRADPLPPKAGGNERKDGIFFPFISEVGS